MAEWLTTENAAAIANCDEREILRELFVTERLRSARIGRRKQLRIRRDWLDRWLDARCKPGFAQIPETHTEDPERDRQIAAGDLKQFEVVNGQLIMTVAPESLIVCQGCSFLHVVLVDVAAPSLIRQLAALLADIAQHME